MASATKKPRHVDPQVWALVTALVQARESLPYESSEARLLDGVARWVRTAATGTTGPDGVVLRPEGPVWAAVLALVGSAARLCGEGSRRLLEPWAGLSPAGAPPGAGVSPARAAAAGFGAGSVDPDLG
jgi:hypothetical protein